MLTLIAQTVETPALPQIASWLQAAGPFGLAAILLIILKTLWSRLRERDERMDAMSSEFLIAIREQSAQQATTAEVLRTLCDTVGKPKD